MRFRQDNPGVLQCQKVKLNVKSVNIWFLTNTSFWLNNPFLVVVCWSNVIIGYYCKFQCLIWSIASIGLYIRTTTMPPWNALTMCIHRRRAKHCLYVIETYGLSKANVVSSLDRHILWIHIYQVWLVIRLVISLRSKNLCLKRSKTKLLS